MRAIVKVDIGKSMIDDVTVVEQTNKIVLGVQKRSMTKLNNGRYSVHCVLGFTLRFTVCQFVQL